MSASDSIEIVAADTATPTLTPADTATPTSTNTPMPQLPTAFVEFASSPVMIGDDVMVTLITTDADEYLLESSSGGGAYTTVLEGDGDINTITVFSADGAPRTVTYRLTATNTVGSVTATDSIEIVAADTATPTNTPADTLTPRPQPIHRKTPPRLRPIQSTPDSQLPTAFVSISPCGSDAR